MMNIKGIFAVSLIAMVAVVAGVHTSNAVAAIASQGYVDQQVGSKANATDLARKVDIYQGDAKANQAVITDGTGNITTGFITKSMLGADVEIPAAITVDSALSSTSTNPVQNKVINTALNAKEVTSNKVTSANYAANVSSDTKYPTVKAVADAIADVEEKIPAKITVDSALSSTSTNPVQNKVINTALSGKEVTSNKVTSTNYAANVSNDTKYPTVKAVANAIADVEEKIPDAITVDSALSSTSTNPVQNKVINTALAGKQATLSAVQLNAVNSGITKDKVTTYDGYNEKITAAQNAADDAAAAANGKVTIAQGSGAVNKAVITNSSGNVTTGTISSGMIADGTITNADISASAAIAQSKISGLTTALAGKVATAQGSNAVNKAVITDASGDITTGQIASGMIANDAVTSAKIADGTITNADIASNAQIAASKVDFSGLSGSTTGGGNVVTNVTQTNGKVSAFKGITAEVASNRVTSTEFDSNTSNDTKYPTVKAVADAIAASATTASDILTTTTVTSQGTGAVLTGVSVTAGKVTLQKGNVQIPSGGQNATSYVSIWVE